MYLKFKFKLSLIFVSLLTVLPGTSEISSPQPQAVWCNYLLVVLFLKSLWPVSSFRSFLKQFLKMGRYHRLMGNKWTFRMEMMTSRFFRKTFWSVNWASRGHLCGHVRVGELDALTRVHLALYLRVNLDLSQTWLGTWLPTAHFMTLNGSGPQCPHLKWRLWDHVGLFED